MRTGVTHSERGIVDLRADPGVKFTMKSYQHQHFGQHWIISPEKSELAIVIFYSHWSLNTCISTLTKIVGSLHTTGIFMHQCILHQCLISPGMSVAKKQTTKERVSLCGCRPVERKRGALECLQIVMSICIEQCRWMGKMAPQLLWRVRLTALSTRHSVRCQIIAKN